MHLQYIKHLTVYVGPPFSIKPQLVYYTVMMFYNTIWSKLAGTVLVIKKKKLSLINCQANHMYNTHTWNSTTSFWEINLYCYLVTAFNNWTVIFWKEIYSAKKYTPPSDIWNSTACVSISACLFSVRFMLRVGEMLVNGPRLFKLSTQEEILAFLQDCIHGSYIFL